MKAAVLITLGLLTVYVALSGKLPQVGAIFREAITNGNTAGNTNTIH